MEQLTTANLAHTFPLCNAPRGCGGADAKSRWASETAAHIPHGVLGYIAYVKDLTHPNGRAVAAVEFLPSTLVPYPIPRKDERSAFITCIYPTKEPDYRHDVLWRLLADLPSYGYSRVLAIAGRNTPYPNGPVSFFREHGFTEVQVLDTEQLPDGIEELALMELSCQR